MTQINNNHQFSFILTIIHQIVDKMDQTSFLKEKSLII
jgi:hypothetical protein